MEIFEQFDVSIPKLIAQLVLWIIICGLPACFATQRVSRHASPASRPLWYLFIWGTPLIGSVIALLTVRREIPRSV